ncbi:hypothetical protein [Limosilactobacillus equigenerosi]|uniref:Uncharacterized protein n=2 Tax=Limosilactobacillus TaxID=2742598 RepID=A0A0R1UFV2_9LACO|nr:hypothetical protein [Limosilactobacillus equigenerosi]KRL92190.1 hypothetical protein FC21_GL000425 [Limosilactobacillus equigenerosi DSM 18793 = JCM 14505]
MKAVAKGDKAAELELKKMIEKQAIRSLGRAKFSQSSSIDSEIMAKYNADLAAFQSDISGAVGKISYAVRGGIEVGMQRKVNDVVKDDFPKAVLTK